MIDKKGMKQMKFKIGVIRGDGIGPEIVAEALKVMNKVAEKYAEEFEYEEILLGGASIDVHGKPLTEEALAAAKSCDAVLMGSIGGKEAGDKKRHPPVGGPGGHTGLHAHRTEGQSGT